MVGFLSRVHAEAGAGDHSVSRHGVGSTCDPSSGPRHPGSDRALRTGLGRSGVFSAGGRGGGSKGDAEGARRKRDEGGEPGGRGVLEVPEGREPGATASHAPEQPSCSRGSLQARRGEGPAGGRSGGA